MPTDPLEFDSKYFYKEAGEFYAMMTAGKNKYTPEQMEAARRGISLLYLTVKILPEHSFEGIVSSFKVLMSEYVARGFAT